MSEQQSFLCSEGNTGLEKFLERQQKRRRREQLLLLALVGSLGAGAYHFKGKLPLDIPRLTKAITDKASRTEPGSIPAEPANACHASFPANGVFIKDPYDTTLSDGSLPILQIENKYSQPVVLLLENSALNAKERFVAIHPGVNLAQHVPQGNYGMTLLLGQSWCNFDKGFTDGRRVRVSKPLQVIAGQSNKVRLDAVGNGIHVDVVHLLAAAPSVRSEHAAVSGSGVIELQRQSNGGFYVDGTVNRVATNFQIDTGASVTSISREMASRAGIYECTPHQFDTANGSVSGCLATAGELAIGSFRFKGFQVAVMPKMKGTLLGMNILRHLHMEHSGDRMRISQGNPASSAPVAKYPVAEAPKPEPESPTQWEDRARSVRNQEVACTQIYKPQKEAIDALMRQGYTSQQGEAYRANLRQLDEAYRRCRESARPVQ